MNEILSKSKKFLSSQQNTILSAAGVITVMIVLAQFFGLIRQWVILKYLGSETFSLYLAAFRLPDLVFEVFAYGAFSSAFIPVFSKYLRKDKSEAWDTASRVINIGVSIFGVIALIFGFFSYQFYNVVAFGFEAKDVLLVSKVARIIFFAQGLFIISYVVTGVLESSRRFLVPALAPVFYNIGIILGTVIFAKTCGIYAPAFGVVIGALMHLGIQLPVAYNLGFRFSKKFIPNDGVKEIGKLAAPRFLDLAFLQIQKSGELFFSSVMSVASYGYLNLASSLQNIPVMLFGVSLAKASFVSLAHKDDPADFRKTFLSTVNQMMFMIVPIAAFLIVLRIPIVRLTYGTSQSLDWNATVQIGLALSAFAFGIPFQGALAIISRAFYAKHDTKTPVILSIVDVILTIILEAIFVFWLHLPIWSIAAANSIGLSIQVAILYSLLAKKIGDGNFLALSPTLKFTFFSVISSLVMFLTLKIFDRSVWVKKLSFLGGLIPDNIPFDRFVLDTRYTLNLVFLTLIVFALGLSIYLLLCWITKSKELFAIFNLFSKRGAEVESAKNEPITTSESEV